MIVRYCLNYRKNTNYCDYYTVYAIVLTSDVKTDIIYKAILPEGGYCLLSDEKEVPNIKTTQKKVKYKRWRTISDSVWAA